ncbi:hypothetical protein BH24DEI2_BH24DEI2_06520 [soil metagenome]
MMRTLPADCLSCAKFAPMKCLYLGFVGLVLASGLAFAAPSTFPETALYFGVGYTSTLAVQAGGEVVLPTPYLDTSLDLTVYADLAGKFGTRLSGSALVFAALGTTPPLALGFGADVGVDGRGVNFHLGPVLGSDLLFVAQLPMTVSAYLGLGYAPRSFSVAWAAQVRYYFDDVAVELATSDLLPLSLGVRYLF